MWREKPSHCPTPETLVADKAIDSAAELTDQWGNPFKIICEDDDVTVMSAGADKKEGTADDIRVPEVSQAKKEL
jgi:general secretion pathway protein G